VTVKRIKPAPSNAKTALAWRVCLKRTPLHRCTALVAVCFQPAVAALPGRRFGFSKDAWPPAIAWDSSTTLEPYDAQNICRRLWALHWQIRILIRWRRWLDLFLFVNSAAFADPIPAEELPAKSRYLWNQRHRNLGAHSDVTQQSGTKAAVAGWNCLTGDYDNDGHRGSVRHANLDHNTLYHNNGDGTFTDVTQTAGVRESRLNPRERCLLTALTAGGKHRSLRRSRRGFLEGHFLRLPQPGGHTTIPIGFVITHLVTRLRPRHFGMSVQRSGIARSA